MKIGIISINMYSKGLNFACPLHNYAFQQFLLKKGIENQIISYKPVYFNDFDLRHPCEYYARLCTNFYASGRHESEVKEWKRITGLYKSWEELYHEREIRYDKFQKFIESNYIKTEECYNSDLLEIKDPGFDCYICCTDVIWKKEPRIGFDRGFFLGSKAMDNKWKISYAASRGAYFSENEEDDKIFFGYVKDIDAISVREESLKKYINENIENEVTRVVDPVLLHDKEFYDRILEKPKEEHYIFLYYVMEKAKDTIAQAVKYARAYNLKIIETTDRPLKEGSLTSYDGIEVIYNYAMGIEEWLGYIRYADCIFTNSFHASCFSILFEKQFYVGMRNGDKVTQLLDMFGLSERRINAESDILTKPLPDIDYCRVMTIMKEKRIISENFILSAIRYMEQNQRQVHDYDSNRHNLTYKITYKSGVYQEIGKGTYSSVTENVQQLPTGEWKASMEKSVKNDGSAWLHKNRFSRKGYLPDGWRLRFKIDKKWFWYMENNTFVEVNECNEEKYSEIRVFQEKETIPYIPVNRISCMEAEALWKKGEWKYEVIYSSGWISKKIGCNYDKVQGEIRISADGMMEYKCGNYVINDSEGGYLISENGFTNPQHVFTGWNIRIEEDGVWYWLLKDTTLKLVEKYHNDNDGEKLLVEPGSKMPYIPSNYVTAVVLEAVWEKSLVAKFKKIWKAIYNASGLGSKRDCAIKF